LKQLKKLPLNLTYQYGNKNMKELVSPAIPSSQPISRKKILLVDLNNEANYPTMAIGTLSTPLKQAGYEVDVFAPLAQGVKALARDQQETFIDYVVARIFYSGNSFLIWANDFIYSTYHRWRFRSNKHQLNAFRKQLDQKRYDGVMVSCYLQYYPLLVNIAAEAKRQDIPLLLGGPYFNQSKVAERWLEIDGVDIVFGGEADFIIPQLAEALITGEGLKEIQGLFRKEVTLIGQQANPIQLTDDLPIPDFSYFNWDNYPHRVLPVMTARGCEWGHCLFCSDVTTASTRTFRTRNLESVLKELKTQSDRYQLKTFIFFDSKLNSDLKIWYGLIQEFQQVIPSATWVASVHVDAKGENGLEADTMRKAFDSGLRRISFGLETASQQLNKRMLKGTDLDRTSQFIKDTHSAGISIRTTVILGYPGERARDVQATADFLSEHFEYLDRVKLSRFKAIPGTAFDERLEKKPHKYPSVINHRWDFQYAKAIFEYPPAREKNYRKAKSNLLKVIHRINKKPLMDNAQQFNGLM
jgi:anaerobic magnesium-protoporphyrin IX monomethyl ester cyclase